jgi:hypothetical protein
MLLHLILVLCIAHTLSPIYISFTTVPLMTSKNSVLLMNFRQKSDCLNKFQSLTLLFDTHNGKLQSKSEEHK